MDATSTPVTDRSSIATDDHALPQPATVALGLGAALVLEACGGGSDGSGLVPPTSSSSSSSSSSAASSSSSSAGLSKPQSARFLAQSAIGYSEADINSVTQLGINTWLNVQFAMPRPQKFWDFLIANGHDAPANVNTNNGFDAMIWSQLMSSADILRQRVGLAVLNQWVVSIDGFSSSWQSFVMAAYLDILWDNALGNYRDIMEGVSTSVAMGYYLTFLGNVKANPTTGAIPDENYARELMQLFTIGLYRLNMDGTQVLVNGSPVPTYTQDDVSLGARIWTGYGITGTDNTTPARMQLPMSITTATHETGATTFLASDPAYFPGISIPANASGTTARTLTLDGLFNHPTLPPFVCKQLIQNLVTSNPSPAYVRRVATVFINNGSGVRGDMKAVGRAILTDTEARADSQVASTTFGKLREPIIRLVQWARAFGVTSPSNSWSFGNLTSSSTALAESPGHAPSVFNWFRPGYTPPGTTIATSGLVAPEFQITNEPSMVGYVNYMQQRIISGAGDALPDYTKLIAIAADSAALLAQLNLMLAANQISSQTLALMKTALDTIAATTSTGINNRVYAAVLLVMASPDYLVLR